MKARSFYLALSFFILAAAIIATSPAKADEENQLQSIQNKNDTVVVEQGRDIFLPEIDGKPVEVGEKLPYGFSWKPDGTLEMPEGVRMNSDGTLVLPNNEYPEPYKVQADGSVIAPNGVKLQNKKPVNDPFSIADALGQLPGKIKPGNDEPKNKKDEKKEKPANKKDKKLRIPKDAAKNNDLSFLAGCWKTDDKYGHTWGTNERHRISIRMCFDRNGRGQYYITSKKGVFSAPLTARLNNDKLSFKHGNAYGKGQSTHYTPAEMFCNGASDYVKCQRICVNPANKKEIRYENFTLDRSK